MENSLLEKALSRVEDTDAVSKLLDKPAYQEALDFELPQSLWEALMNTGQFTTYFDKGILYGFIEFPSFELKYGIALGWHGDLMKDWYKDTDGHFIDTDLDKSFRRYALKHIHYWQKI